MLDVCLRKLCPQDSFGYAVREKKTVRKSTPLEPLEPLLGRPGPLLGASWVVLGPPRADLDDLDDVCGAALKQATPYTLQCLWASRASRRGPKSGQNRPGRRLGRLVGPKVGLEGPS